MAFGSGRWIPWIKFYFDLNLSPEGNKSLCLQSPWGCFYSDCFLKWTTTYQCTALGISKVQSSLRLLAFIFSSNHHCLIYANYTDGYCPLFLEEICWLWVHAKYGIILILWNIDGRSNNMSRKFHKIFINFKIYEIQLLHQIGLRLPYCIGRGRAPLKDKLTVCRHMYPFSYPAQS